MAVPRRVVPTSRAPLRWVGCVVLCLALAAAGTVALAADAPPPKAQAEGPGFWARFFDSTFALILFFIFLPVVVTTFIAARQRDRCLKTFSKFHTTVTTKAGKAIWGVLRVFSKGLVVTYRSPMVVANRPDKTSYMMYEPDMAEVFTIFRFHDQITEKNQRRRDRQIRKLAYPGFFGRLWRRLRNLINTLRDGFNKAIGAILGQMQKAKPGSKALKSGNKQIGEVGTTLLGQVANAYEPLLEQCIGSPVVLEISGPGEGERKEYAGQLGEYSAGYLMVLDIDAEIEATAVVDGPGAFDEQVIVRQVDDGVEIQNGLAVEVRAISVSVGGPATSVGATIAPRETARLPVALSELAPPPAPGPAEGEEAPPPPPPTPPTVTLAARRQTDIMAPRAHALIRHSGVMRSQ